MARKRLGLNKLNKTVRTPKKRTNRVRVGLDQRNLATYPIYIGDRTSSSGRKVPIIGTINTSALNKLGLKLADLQKFPDSTYVTTAGLKITYVAKDGVMWKQTTGKSGDIDYNSSEPIPKLSNPAKLEIFLKPSKEKATDVASIGIPSLTSIATVAEFVARLKLDKNDKALRWKWGKSGVTLQDQKRKSSGTRKSKGTSVQYLVPIGYDSSTKLNKDGARSASVAQTKKTLVCATIESEAIFALGINIEGETSLAEIKNGTQISNSIDNNAIGGKAKYYDVFSKLKAYVEIWSDQTGGEKAGLLDPGTAMSVKVRFTKFKKGEALGNISKGRTERNVNASSKSYTFSLPAGVPVGIIFEMLQNCSNRPTSFQVSADKKTYGKSYRLPAPRGKSQLIGR